MRRLMIVMLVLAFAAAACGGTENVGEGLETSGEGDGGGIRSSAPPSEEPSPTADSEPTSEPSETRASPSKSAPPQRPSAEFSITLAGFEPSSIRVRVGGIVEVTNEDDQPRSVRGSKGEFDSGLLDPGEKWRYKATTPGKYNLEDETRPYVQGNLEVLA